MVAAPERENGTNGIQHVPEKVQITHLAHMVYAVRSLEIIKTFLLDFGMQIAQEHEDAIWFRGYGTQPYVFVAQKAAEKEFRGGAWAVQSREDLERVARMPGASQITALRGPGGGYEVVVRDPCEGYPFRFVHGQVLREVEGYKQPIRINHENVKPRANAYQRFQPGPAPVHKLGHYGVGVLDFPKMYAWLVEHFNFKASDILVDDEGAEVGGFMRVNLGQKHSDHHSFFIAQVSNDPQVHHCSFEIHDSDTQHLSHQYLTEKGYELSWGVGRHILGSQIFDYWYMPETHFMIEHYCDGDILNDEVATSRVPAKDEMLSVWGPSLPETFLPH